MVRRRRRRGDGRETRVWRDRVPPRSPRSSRRRRDARRAAGAGTAGTCPARWRSTRRARGAPRTWARPNAANDRVGRSGAPPPPTRRDRTPPRRCPAAGKARTEEEVSRGGGGGPPPSSPRCVSTGRRDRTRVGSPYPARDPSSRAPPSERQPPRPARPRLTHRRFLSITADIETSRRLRMETFGRTVVEIHSLGARHDADARGRARVDERRRGVAARGGRARVQLPALERVRQGTPRLAVDASKRSGRLNTRIDTCGGFSRANQSLLRERDAPPRRGVCVSGRGGHLPA